MSEGPELTCNECHGNGWHNLTCSAVRAALAIGVSAEERRAQRHHDVLCLVLKELVINVRSTKVGGDFVLSSNTERVKIAREYANLAYPPPKDETAIHNDYPYVRPPPKAEPFDNARAVKEWEARNWAPKAEEP